MGQKVVPVETKYAAMFALVGAGEESVTALCARLGISRKSYYKYRARFQAEGLDGLRPRSRRPQSNPRLTPPAMVELIVATRVKLLTEGWEGGGLSIRNRLLREGHQPPAWRTIHRVLVRAGVVEPDPSKRPRVSGRRFEFPAPDDCWQIDAFDSTLAGGREVVVFEVKDDCSRTQIANLAWPAEDTEGAWECLARGIDAFGKPAMVLSDNSLAFSGKLHHTMVQVEKNLAELKIKAITSRPRHPQTCGKTSVAIPRCAVGWRPGRRCEPWSNCRFCSMSISSPTTTGPIKVWIPTKPRWSGGSPPAGTRRQVATRSSSRPPSCGTAKPGSAATCNGTATASRSAGNWPAGPCWSSPPGTIC